MPAPLPIDTEARATFSSTVEAREEVEPLSLGLLGTFNVDDLRLLPFEAGTCRAPPAQLLGTLIAQRLWKFNAHAVVEKSVENFIL